MTSTSVSAAEDAGSSFVHGKWQWTRRENRCTETYEFRANGSVTIQSGAERTDATYELDVRPDTVGFYKLKMKVLKDHGGRDCADSDTDDTGTENTNYLLFEPGRTMMIICAVPRLERCFGPLKRVGSDA